MSSRVISIDGRLKVFGKKKSTTLSIVKAAIVQPSSHNIMWDYHGVMSLHNIKPHATNSDRPLTALSTRDLYCKRDLSCLHKKFIPVYY